MEAIHTVISSVNYHLIIRTESGKIALRSNCNCSDKEFRNRRTQSPLVALTKYPISIVNIFHLVLMITNLVNMKNKKKKTAWVGLYATC